MLIVASWMGGYPSLEISHSPMNGVRVFDEHAQDYDRWFDDNERVYQNEVDAVHKFLPASGIGIEVGVGTGRFAVPLCIKIGIDPSEPMTRIAKCRGMAVCRAIGECLPFRNDQFDFVLVDLYLGDQCRTFVYTPRFLKDIKQLGHVAIFNHLFYDDAKHRKAEELVKKLKAIFPDIRLHRVLTNLMIICE